MLMVYLFVIRLADPDGERSAFLYFQVRAYMQPSNFFTLGFIILICVCFETIFILPLFW